MATKTFFFQAIFLDSVLLINRTLIRRINYKGTCAFTARFISHRMLGESSTRGDRDLKTNIEILN